MKTKVESKSQKKKLASEKLNSILNDLKKNGLKLTPPRKAIIVALVQNHGPFTAEEVHKLVTKKICDLATVYRCLASLAEAEILRRVEFGDGTSRYELSESESHHHHLICTECKSIEIVDDPDIEEIDRYAKKRGFSNVSHNLEFFGTCPKCA